MGHGLGRATFVRDGAESDVLQYEIDAQAKSGDYFVSLATELDMLSAQITDKDVRIRLEDLVSDLIYLQDHYEITKKELG